MSNKIMSAEDYAEIEDIAFNLGQLKAAFMILLRDMDEESARTDAACFGVQSRDLYLPALRLAYDEVCRICEKAERIVFE